MILDEETRDAIIDSCLDDSTKIISYLDPVIDENISMLEKQVKAIEEIALRSKEQTSSSMQQVSIMKEQLELAKQESASAKKMPLLQESFQSSRLSSAS